MNKLENSARWIFLLGGHDLEMVEIKDILQQRSYKLYDNNLNWGACLSSYRDVLNEYDHFIGIELIEDISTPKDYTRIDHHNEWVNRSSSLEQIAEMLGIQLTERQMLIAANDKGYLPAMKELGATDEQILKIRSLDRKAQGVTERDEHLAEMSIQTSCRVIQDLIIVKSFTDKFSPITDRLYPYQKLLIFNSSELIYYGAGINIVRDRFKEYLDNKQAFVGGKGPGFFGLTKGAFSESEILKIKNIIIDILTN
jgi:hypothetical protein